MNRTPHVQAGAVYLIALLLLALFSATGAALVWATGSGMRQAGNLQAALQARLAAESGLDFALRTLERVRVPGDTPPAALLAALHAEMSRLLDGTPNLQSGSVQLTASSIDVPEIAAEHGQFSFSIRPVDAATFRVDVCGRSRGIERRLSMLCQRILRRAAVFDYGMASRGQVIVSGHASVIGVNNDLEASVLSATTSTPDAIRLEGSVKVSGDLYTCGDDSYVALTGSPTVAGTTSPAEIAEHVHNGVDPPDFPAIDTTDLEQLAVNLVDSSTDFTFGATYNNIRIKAGTNPTFNNNVTINGIVFVEAPNTVTFNGGLVLNGLVVTQDSEQDLADCQLKFAGHVTANGVEALPDTEEFAAVKQQTGTFVLAPGFGVTFSGSFDTVNGNIAADQLTFSGTAEGTVRGTLVGLTDRPTALGGNVDIYVDRGDTSQNPAGFLPSIGLAPLPDTYVESVLANTYAEIIP